MSKIFLDTNYFIDSIHQDPESDIRTSFKDNVVYISPLSVHLFCYVFKIKIPNQTLSAFRDKFQVTELSENILDRALQGPTLDLEDHIELHSCAEAECDIFLTADKKLLAMKFFGKVKILSSN